jgi:hypothetical protein
MKKFLGITTAVLALIALAPPARAQVPVPESPIVASFDSGLVTSVAIERARDTRNAKECTILVNNKDGDGTRTLDVACMDPTGVTTLYEHDQVTVAQADYARVVIDPTNAVTGSDTTKFQWRPCGGITKAVLGARSGKVARMTMTCH